MTVDRDELGRIVREGYKKALEEVRGIVGTESSLPYWDDVFLDETKSEIHEQGKEIDRKVGEYVLEKIKLLQM